MAETQTSPDEHSVRARIPQQDSHPERDSAAQASESESPLNVASLLRSTGLNGRGSSTVRAETLHGAQQTHGNRAVQRFMSQGATSGRTVSVQRSAAPTPVQRWGGNAGWQRPGGNNEAGPYGYGQYGQYGPYGVPGVGVGGGVVGGQGNVGGIPVSTDDLYGQGRAGAWDDGSGGTRYGATGNAGVAKLGFNNGGTVSGDAEALTANAEASMGSNGATLGAGATLVGGSMTAGGPPSAASSTDESARFGVSANVGLAGRLHWGDADGDGYPEYGFGADIGPFSGDVKTEDPLRTAAGMVDPWSRLYLPDGNLTQGSFDAASNLGAAAREWAEGLDLPSPGDLGGIGQPYEGPDFSGMDGGGNVGGVNYSIPDPGDANNSWSSSYGDSGGDGVNYSIPDSGGANNNWTSSYGGGGDEYSGGDTGGGSSGDYEEEDY